MNEGDGLAASASRRPPTRSCEPPQRAMIGLDARQRRRGELALEIIRTGQAFHQDARAARRRRRDRQVGERRRDAHQLDWMAQTHLHQVGRRVDGFPFIEAVGARAHGRGEVLLVQGGGKSQRPPGPGPHVPGIERTRRRPQLRHGKRLTGAKIRFGDLSSGARGPCPRLQRRIVATKLPGEHEQDRRLRLRRGLTDLGERPRPLQRLRNRRIGTWDTAAPFVRRGGALGQPRKIGHGQNLTRSASRSGLLKKERLADPI